MCRWPVKAPALTADLEAMTSRRILPVLALLLVGSLASPAASPAAKHRPAPRKGGHVRLAWPSKAHRTRGDRPGKLMARFLARQVGPVRATAASSSVAHAATTGPLQDFLPAATPGALRLVRSFDIPSDDPAAARLANRSFTYDSAIAAIALIGAGERVQAEQILDQLAALQRTDGSIDFAFNVADGSSIQQFRTGSIAWIGLAATVYGNTYNSSRYDNLAGGAARWVLARQQPSGLLAGGPDVSWVSTQHNLVAWFFLNTVDKHATGYPPGQLKKDADSLATAIQRDLIVNVDATKSAFVQGAADTLRPLDVQTLGLLFLSRNPAGKSANPNLARVRAYLNTLAVSGRSVDRSTDPVTFNQTYSATGPFSGYRPYAEAGPDVLWAEGTAQVRYTLRSLGESTTALNGSIGAWDAITSGRGEGPLGADRTVTGHLVNEYHVWPASAAASWTLLGSTTTLLGF